MAVRPYADDHHITGVRYSRSLQGSPFRLAATYPTTPRCCARHAPGATPTRALKLRLKAGRFS